MKIKSQTWILLVILALMVGATFYLNNQKKVEAANATPTAGVAYIFTATDGIANSIEIKPAIGDSVKIARDANNVWALELPVKTEANQSSAEAAATQISALQILSAVDADPSIFGFNAPAFIITVGFANGKTHTLEVGDKTPTGVGYYVRLDKNKMMISDSSGIESLTQLVSFPPYLNTPTPIPPTPTLVAPTVGAPTPDLSVTPTP